MRRIQLIALCCVLVRSTTAGSQLPCYGVNGTPVPCYPPYEDAAAGLVPTATSTCSSSGPACDKCSPCDASVPSQSHAAGLATDGNSVTYWQSAKVSPGESVNLTFHLSGAYEVKEVAVEFVGPPPNATAVLTSADGGKTFSALLSYSAALCGGKGTCTAVTLQLLPDSRQKVTFALRQDAEPADAIRLGLYPASDHVAVANVSITARCACNGHASSCAREGGNVPVCNCSHNSEGKRCETCSSGYGKQPWYSSGGDSATAFVCEACSECYQGVEQYQNMTTTVFKVFVERMNATLSSVDVLGELVRYQQLIQSLHQKAKSLAAEVVVLVNKQNEFVTQDTAFDMSTMAYKTSILTANKGVVGLSARVSIQSALLINLANITDMVEVLEKTITSQIQLSLELLNETQQAFLKLDGLARKSDAISRDQMLQAQGLLARAQETFALASDAFRLSRLAIVLQNVTVANLATLEAHDLITLNNLYLESKSNFESILKSAPVIASDSQSLLNQTRDPTPPDFDADILYLSNWVSRLTDMSQTLWNRTGDLTTGLLEEESSFGDLNATAHLLLDRSVVLRERAAILVRKAEGALRTADTTVQGTQGILRQSLDLLDQLNASLVNLSNFKSQLDSLVEGIGAAQRRSGLALSVASQANLTLLQAAVVVDAALGSTEEATLLLNQAYVVISRSHVTSSVTHNSTEALKTQLNSLVNVSNTLHTDLDVLGKRASADRAAIVNASLSANLSSSRTLQFREKIAVANSTLSQLRAELSSLHPVPPERISGINATLARLEEEAVQNQALINMTQQLILQLETSAKQLEDKYTTLKQQRDLLQQILNNLSNLDCRKQYSAP